MIPGTTIALAITVAVSGLTCQTERDRAAALIQRSIRAHGEVQSVAYAARSGVDMLDGGVSTTAGRVVFERDPDDELVGARIRIELSSNEGTTVVYARGSQTLLLPHLERALVARGGSIGLVSGRIYYANVVDPNLLRRWNPTNRPTLNDILAKASSLSVGEPSIVGEVPCDVVAYEMPEDWRRLRYRGEVHIGREDGLPRKVVHLARRAEGQEGGARFTVTDLELNPTRPEGTFTLDVPRDFEIFELDSELPAEPSRFVDAGDPAPQWVLSDAGGNVHRLVDLRGKVVVLDFWGTWCGPCVAAMPRIQALHDRFEGRDVVVIGISCKEKPDADPAAFMKESGFDYGLLLNGEDVAAAHGIPAYPTLFVVGRDQRIAYRTVGFTPEELEKVTAIIEQQLSRGR